MSSSRPHRRQYRLWAARLICSAAICISLGLAGWHARGGRLLSVQTGSMTPTIHPGDALLLRRISFASLRPGDVVSYRSSVDPKALISHRVVAVQPAAGTFVTKGDNLPTPDPPANSRQLVGQVTAILPGLGWVIDLFRRPLWVAVLVAAPATVLLGYELWRAGVDYGRPSYRLPGRRVTKISWQS